MPSIMNCFKIVNKIFCFSLFFFYPGPINDICLSSFLLTKRRKQHPCTDLLPAIRLN